MDKPEIDPLISKTKELVSLTTPVQPLVYNQRQCMVCPHGLVSIALSLGIPQDNNNRIINNRHKQHIDTIDIVLMLLRPTLRIVFPEFTDAITESYRKLNLGFQTLSLHRWLTLDQVQEPLPGEILST